MPGRRCSGDTRGDGRKRRPQQCRNQISKLVVETRGPVFESNSRMRRVVSRTKCACVLLAALLTGCMGGKQRSAYTPGNGGSPQAGKFVIAKYKCGSCHTIPGIRDATGVFGPPLNSIASRSIIGGNFPNDPSTLEHWVMDAPSMKPATAMPDLGLSQTDARNVVAYLETLH